MNACSLTEKEKKHAIKDDPTSGPKSALSSYKETSSSVESDGLKMVAAMKRTFGNKIRYLSISFYEK
jgi:hypothetical protein